MTVRDFIIWVAESPDIEVERDVLEPQEIILLIDDQERQLKEVWVRGDNKLILEAQKKL